MNIYADFCATKERKWWFEIDVWLHDARDVMDSWSRSLELLSLLLRTCLREMLQCSIKVLIPW